FTLARTLTPDLKRVVIAVVATVLALCIPGSPGQIAAITLGGLAGLWWCRTPAGDTAALSGPLVRNLSKRAAVCCLAVLAALLVALPVLTHYTGQPLIALADAFSRAGALVFGGGHVVLPLLQAEPWVASSVAPDALLAGFGAAQAVPGPLFTFAAYLGAIGYPTTPLVAASIALVAVFVPGILLLCGVLPFWNQVRQKPNVAAAIRGASAAVVGLLAAALISPLAAASLTGWAPVTIALGAFAMLMLRLPPWLIVVCGATAGALTGLGATG
ncbi:MAG: chromate transporter, partial [Leucobacter sp.]|nr:chromate transporter [Leucobacter sp.]